MSKNGITEGDLLRGEFVQLRRKAAAAVQAASKLEHDYQVLSRAFATLLHSRGELSVELPNSAAQAAFDACWHRLDLEVLVPPEDAPEGAETALKVSLVPVTKEERKKAEKARKKLEKKAPKILGADGQELDS